MINKIVDGRKANHFVVCKYCGRLYNPKVNDGKCSECDRK